MLTKRTYFVPVLIACVVFPAAALAAVGHGPDDERVGVGGARPAPIAVLHRPVARFHRAIHVTVRRIRRARRAERRRQLYASLPGGVSRATLEAIASCESGGNPAAVSAGGDYRGKYQFSVGTWESVGGSGDPAAAPEAEQDYRAALLYAASGSSPWPVCGS